MHMYSCTRNVYPCISHRLPSGGHRYHHSVIIADATVMVSINAASALARRVYDCMAYRLSSHHVHLLHIYTPHPLSFGWLDWCCRTCRTQLPQLRYSIPICISLVDLVGICIATPPLISFNHITHHNRRRATSTAICGDMRTASTRYAMTAAIRTHPCMPNACIPYNS